MRLVAAHSVSRVPVNRPLLRPQLRVVAALTLVLATFDCNAYIDPNAGGLLYQILLPVIVAVVAGWRYLKMALLAVWQRLTGKALPRDDDAP